MNFDDLLTQSGEWLRGSGPESDIVISSRVRLARNLLSIFKPRVTAVVLQNADVAHGSFNGYSEVIRRNDAAIGELWQAVQADPELAERAAAPAVGAAAAVERLAGARREPQLLRRPGHDARDRARLRVRGRGRAAE